MEKLYQNKEWLYQKYIIEECSMSEIADICNCNFTTIRYWLKKHVIQIRTTKEAQNTKRCKQKKSETMKKKYENDYINPMKDKHHTFESIIRISETMNGKSKSEEHK